MISIVERVPYVGFRCGPMLRQLALITAGMFAAVTADAAPASQDSITAGAQTASTSPDRPSSAASNGTTDDKGDRACVSADPRKIVVCGERGKGYRVDPDTMEASRELSVDERSANSATPSAQALCASQPMGCGHGLESLDLANAADVIGTAVARAARGKDWIATFKTTADEYQLYPEAKRGREARELERAAAKVRMNARAAAKRALGRNGSEELPSSSQ